MISRARVASCACLLYTSDVYKRQDNYQAELAEQKDRYLRLAADFDNFRKRTAQESERRSSAKKEALIQDLLPIIDNLRCV